ncbi:hypothetical protein NADFUDRAFT_52320 [Nadsonia fulvescens var. elongata DSM 6958]|uniref:Uncharacterized protein n=1 Tax=Nadsonia fulvescens var. elongata DSM 6958 TaxID=857566 RepID=A0A1E3PGZ7_9ASCO|nr:hypothetical protein NADFUDRAFT_52320 [Nadsonia fulvescens var. elongata DSM 6958]
MQTFNQLKSKIIQTKDPLPDPWVTPIPGYRHEEELKLRNRRLRLAEVNHEHYYGAEDTKATRARIRVKRFANIATAGLIKKENAHRAFKMHPETQIEDMKTENMVYKDIFKKNNSIRAEVTAKRINQLKTKAKQMAAIDMKIIEEAKAKAKENALKNAKDLAQVKLAAKELRSPEKKRIIDEAKSALKAKTMADKEAIEQVKDRVRTMIENRQVEIASIETRMAIENSRFKELTEQKIHKYQQKVDEFIQLRYYGLEEQRYGIIHWWRHWVWVFFRCFLVHLPEFILFSPVFYLVVTPYRWYKVAKHYIIVNHKNLRHSNKQPLFSKSTLN